MTAARSRSGHAATYLVRAAVTAPSLHNSQPWRFVSRDGGIELYADAGRRAAVADPYGREMVLSCGAALFNLRLAMRYLGFLPDVRTFPAPERPALLAEVRWGSYVRPSPEEVEMHRAMPLRHTHRGPFLSDPLPASLIEELIGQARAEGAVLHMACGTEPRRRLAQAIRTAEAVQRTDPGFVAELSRWSPVRGGGRLDGVPAGACPYYPDATVFAGRDFAGWARQGHQTGFALRTPWPLGLVALLTTRHDGRRDWLRAGQALQRVLLCAAAHEVRAAFHTQPLELPDLRRRIRRTVTADAYPQMILRLGYAGRRTRPSPRRPVADVLT